jgi:hypothetical protein
MRMGSSAAFFRLSMPPSENEEEVTANGAAASAGAANPLENAIAIPAKSVKAIRPNVDLPLSLAGESYHHTPEARHGSAYAFVLI